MTKRHCYVTDVGDAIEKLADALDPERAKPFKGDILDLLEWATKDVLTLSAENEKAWARHEDLRQGRDQLREQVSLLRDALKQARHMIYYGEPQIGWNITRIDEVLAATKEN